jgi:hypothetical protein
MSIESKLQEFLHTRNVPHLLFYGSNEKRILHIVVDFVQQIYDHDRHLFKNNTMTVNCAQGKGIKFIREDLKLFAKTNVCGKTFKSIILLSAEKLTVDAQSALRRSIELYSYSTRFFLIVRNKSQLLSPILSRLCELFVADEDRSKQAAPFAFEEPGDTKDNVELAHRFYNEGVHSVQLLQALLARLNDTNNNKLEMYFYQIKAHIRSEPLLMLALMEHYVFLQGLT